MRILFLECCILAVSVVSAASGQDTLGVVNAFRTQTAAWESGDVLIRIEEFYDSTGKDGVGQFKEAVGFHRFRFDHQQKLYFYYGFTERRTGSVDDVGRDAQERRVMERKAFLLSGDKGFVREFPNRMRPAQGKNVSETIAEMKVGFLDLRQIGFCSFGSYRRGCADLTAAAMSSDLALQSSAIAEDDAIRIEFQLPARRSDLAGVAELVPTFVWNWDDRRLVPTKLSLYERGVLRGREFTGLRWTEDYSWEEKQGIVVPVGVKQIIPGNVKRGDEIVTYERQQFATLHWFSVNQGLPESTQSINLDELAPLEALVDPKKTGATEILEAR